MHKSPQMTLVVNKVNGVPSSGGLGMWDSGHYIPIGWCVHNRTGGHDFVDSNMAGVVERSISVPVSGLT
jgi:hypothetical protein